VGECVDEGASETPTNVGLYVSSPGIATVGNNVSAATVGNCEGVLVGHCVKSGLRVGLVVGSSVPAETVGNCEGVLVGHCVKSGLRVGLVVGTMSDSTSGSTTSSITTSTSSSSSSLSSSEVGALVGNNVGSPGVGPKVVGIASVGKCVGSPAVGNMEGVEVDGLWVGS